MGSTLHFGSRTQATIALSSAEAELYAINTGATESLQFRNSIQEALNIKKVNIRIHTDSSSGKSMATRIGSSKKAKHIELKHLFIQQLVQHDLARILKINTANNTADIITKYVATETLLSISTMLGSQPSITSNSSNQQDHCSNCLIMQSVRAQRTHKHTLIRAMVLTTVSNTFYILYIFILQDGGTSST